MRAISNGEEDIVDDWRTCNMGSSKGAAFLAFCLATNDVIEEMTPRVQDNRRGGEVRVGAVCCCV